MINNWFKRFIFPVLLLLFGFLGIWSFFHPGFFPSHDGEWMIVRFSDFHRSLIDGQWPVRLAGRLNFGYGYPVFNFLYPGTFYLTEIFHLLKLNFVDSVKTMFIVSFLLSGIFMYLFSKEWVGKLGGLTAAVLYMYTPYRFVDMYVRGSLGESVAFIFPPLIFWAITKNYKIPPVIASPERSEGRGNLFRRLLRHFVPRNDITLWIGVGAIGIAGLVTTHNVIAYLFLPIIILFILFLHFTSSSRKNVNLFSAYCVLFTVLGIAASAFFWLPALWDKQYTIFDQVVISDFSKNFPSIAELIFPSWGFGPSRPGDLNSMSFQIGVVNLTVLITIVFFLIKRRLSTYFFSVIPTESILGGPVEESYLKETVVKDSSTSLGMTSAMLFFLTITLLAIFFMTSYSQPVWNLIPGLSLIQFPWRILSVTTFTTAVLAGFLLKEVGINRLKYILATLIITFSIALNFSYTKPKEFVNRGEGYYFTNDDTTTVQDEYLPIWAKNLPRERAKNKVELISGEGMITDLITRSNKTNFIYNGSAAPIKINTVYFPGWEAYVNGKKKNIIIDKQGFINLALREGKSLIDVKFMETPMRKLSDIVTFVSIIVIAVLLIKSVLNKKITMSVNSAV